MCGRIDQYHTFAHRLENSRLSPKRFLLRVPLRHLGDIHDRAEDPAIRLHRTGTQLEVAGPALRVDDDLVKVAWLAGVHDMFKYFMHVSTVGWRRKILYWSTNPALRRHTVHCTIQEHTLSAPVEQGKPVSRAGRDRLQRHL